mmetsp:Transcript_4627/g.10272  ORF Transcript_4627/g.10272 Transcript_4627/m.10272 type:complete len:495 (-) Transcript_4627:103-1587(-)
MKGYVATKRTSSLSSTTTDSADPDDISNAYNECVKEIRNEGKLLGSLALHQEAMKRLAQRQSDKAVEARERNQLQQEMEQVTERQKRPSLDMVTQFFGLDDELNSKETATAVQDFYPLTQSVKVRTNFDRSLSGRSINTASSYSRKSSANTSSAKLSKRGSFDALRSLGSRNGSFVSGASFASRGSLDALRSMLGCSFVEEDKNHSQEPIMLGRRTSALVTSDNEEGPMGEAAQMMKDLELSDSEDDNSVGSDGSVDNGKEQEGNDQVIRRSSASRRSSLRRSLKRPSFKRRGSITMGVKKFISRRASNVSSSSCESSQKSGNSGSSASHSPRFRAPKQQQEEEETDSNSTSEDGGEEKKSERPMLRHGVSSRRNIRRRRSSLVSVDEGAALNNDNLGASLTLGVSGLDMSIGDSLDGSFSSVKDGSLICGWGRQGSMASSTVGEEKDGLICAWASRRDSGLTDSVSSMPEEGHNVGNDGGEKGIIPGEINCDF